MIIIITPQWWWCKTLESCIWYWLKAMRLSSLLLLLGLWWWLTLRVTSCVHPFLKDDVVIFLLLAACHRWLITNLLSISTYSYRAPRIFWHLNSSDDFQCVYVMFTLQSKAIKCPLEKRKKETFSLLAGNVTDLDNECNSKIKPFFCSF